MPAFPNESQAINILYYVAAVLVVALLVFLAYKLGRMLGVRSQRKQMDQKERELFQAQRGFKKVYDTEMHDLRNENETLKSDKELLEARVEEYRRKAAGYGGLFNGGGKKADAMYALLLENEALEEALFTQNDKLRQERTEAVKEQLRAASYRRVLMSQLMEEGKITGTAKQVLGEPGDVSRQLPGDVTEQHGSADVPR
ncbi:MAG: hypothetical protein AAGK78_12445 [Planctomycetota bacterium]